MLIVEDDYFTSMGYQSALQSAGFEVIGAASTFEDALMIASAERPDLVIMDISIRGPKDGVEAALVLRERLGVPSLFVSAFISDASRTRAEPAEPVGWLAKPVAMETLVAHVASALGKQSGRQ